MAAADSPTPISLLFVDDEPPMLRLVQRELSGAPYEILLAHGPGEALEVLAGRRVDVLVSDVDMPEMTGVELVQIARRDHPSTLRMLLTANATIDKALHAINEGEVHRFFTKPFDGHLFLETMERLEDRILKMRDENVAEQRRARRAEFMRWLDESFPGATAIDRNQSGEAVVDLIGLVCALEAAGHASIRELVRHEG